MMDTLSVYGNMQNRRARVRLDGIDRQVGRPRAAIRSLWSCERRDADDCDDHVCLGLTRLYKLRKFNTQIAHYVI